MKIKLMIATPAYDGKVNVPYTLSLYYTIDLLKNNNIDVVPLIVTSSSLLVAERNRLLEAFYQSDCTHILCIDSDLGWPGEAVLAMLQQNKDFIAGIYPSRGEGNVFVFRPIKNENGSIVRENHLLKMDYIPAGFLLLSKECIRKMREKFPELYFEPKDKTPDITDNLKSPGFCLFDTEVWDGEFWGEDYVFCRRAREAGIDIWVDPYIQFDHSGKIGMLIECLTTDPTGKTPINFNQQNNILTIKTD